MHCLKRSRYDVINVFL